MDAQDQFVLPAIETEHPLPVDVEVTSQPADETLFVEPISDPPAEDPKQRWRVAIEGAISALYDNNIFTQPRGEKDDLIVSISPVINFIYGDFRLRKDSFLLFSYSPTARYYLDYPSENAVDHDAIFQFRNVSGKLSTDLKLRFQSLSDNEVDVGTLTTRYVYSGTFNLNYAFSGKGSVDLDLSHTAYDYETRLDSHESLVKTWLNYQIAPKSLVGFGFGAGYLEPDGSPAQSYEQASVRAVYLPSSKIELRFEGGAELRQLETGDRVTPLGLIGATYMPFDGTSLSIEFSRKVRSSAALIGRNYEATSAIFKARQRFWQKYFFTVRAGYTYADYYSTDFDRPTDREDDYFFIRPAFEYQANKWLKVEVFYQFRENDSNSDRNAFANHQVGFQASVAF